MFGPLQGRDFTAQIRGPANRDFTPDPYDLLLLRPPESSAPSAPASTLGCGWGLEVGAVRLPGEPCGLLCGSHVATS